ncbi:T9SS type A sorting domain-containing protein [Aquimarina sp. 2201CG5-10]|uniref:T9SS type A sorting domain-containing protein n=1 Tax=Aquimarina callyspongiae TaxID=3098150 RepID=UPI002AB3CF3B|nr:T9SS type A sorting domain-containing protein [Aquimarina sp. 2201CG5-10]MDY8138391.1 T9SS type A sorting domain-containing protein [Aquimarina sp. 2201CG5-10]
MKTHKLIFKLVMLLLLMTVSNQISAQESAIYAGGPIYNNRNVSINELRNSGYTTVIVWTIHIEANGDLGFNGEFPLVQNGVYVGDQSYPNFPNDIIMLKTAPTSINRVEFGLSAAGSGTFAAVRNFYDSEGFGPGTTLYKNFEALKNAIPGIDAFNNDDESTYHVPSAVAFTKMLAGLGYKNAIVPYTRSSFWSSLVSQVNAAYPGNIDRNYLQCYAGGSGNNPCSSSWDFGIPVYPGLWGGSGQSSIATVESRMNSWQNSCGITGGFMWLYDDFDNSSDVAGYAAAINNALSPGNAPGTATAPNPTNGATNVSTNISLSWSAGSEATSHNVYFGTDPALGTGSSQGNQSTTTFDPGNLNSNTTYYWRIDEVNSIGTTTGQIWDFTTTNTTSTIVDHTDPVGTGIITARAQINTAEGADKAFDNLATNGTQNSNWSKWLDNGGTPNASNPSWIQIQLPAAVIVNKLAITSANDFLDRDPEDFNIQGSNDGTNWITLSSWSGQTWSNRFQRKEFTFTNTTNYTYYRINTTKNRGAISMTQICEIELLGPEGTTNPPGGCTGCIDFNTISLSSYANQDADGTFFIEDNGETARLVNNTWKRSSNGYTITPNTVLEFEFKSSNEGEIHGIGFDENNSLSSNRIFKVHGTQNWGIGTYDNYDSSGNYKTYVIPVGNSYTGNAMNLILVNDNDGGSGNNGSFKNIRIYENSRASIASLVLNKEIIDELDDEPLKTLEVNDLAIYPNPFTNRIQLRLPKDHEFTSLQIFSITGQLVRQQNINSESNTILIEALESFERGIFLLKLENNKKTIIYKLIKN